MLDPFHGGRLSRGGRLVEMDDKSLTIEVRLETRRTCLAIRSRALSGWTRPQNRIRGRQAGQARCARGWMRKRHPTGNRRAVKKWQATRNRQPAKPGAEPGRVLKASQGGKDSAPNSLPSLNHTASTRVQSLAGDGLRLTFQPEKLVPGNTLHQAQATCSAVGEFEQRWTNSSLAGPSSKSAVLPYPSWNLRPAIEPRFAQANGQSGNTPGIESELVGKLAPDFELDTLDGQKFRLSDQRKKIVVLDFFATWCGPCMQTLL